MKMRKFLKKYSGREKRRVEDYLHKVSSIIVSEAVKYNAKIVMENLKHIRKSANRKNKKSKKKVK
ncbi:MAG: IS200/IS605 family accessory protein TnpB-related protein [Candidatus Baldrarchaeia archaeon]